MSDQPARPYIGGQAVIEGVMMRSPSSVAVVCRRRSGELVVREQPMTKTRAGLWMWPFVRGMTTLVESLRLGWQALNWSAEVYEQDYDDVDGEGAACELGGKEVSTSSTADPSKSYVGLFRVVFTLFIFVMLPQLGAEGMNKLFHLGLEVTSPAYQAITGAAKLIVVIGLMLLIRRLPEGRRLFQYHGAEHKAISTYEAGEPLEVENARRKTTLHPRCGTTFLVMVALVSIMAFTVAGMFLPKLPGGRAVEFVGFIFIKLPFLPLIASATFELQRLFARYFTVGPLRVVLWPGFLVQKITTAEPDDAQLEVALASLRATLWREDAVAAPVPPDRIFEDYEKLLADPGYAGAHG